MQKLQTIIYVVQFRISKFCISQKLQATVGLRPEKSGECDGKGNLEVAFRFFTENHEVDALMLRSSSFCSLHFRKNCLNNLNPTGYVMHQQFNIQQLYALPTLYLCVLYLSENKQRLVSLTA